MVRINLLPPEITERRKFETRFTWVIVVGVGVLVVIGVIFVGLLLVVNAQNSELQQQLEANAQVQQQADAYAVFEQKEAELVSRKQVAQLALDGRVEWARLTNELSLIMPTDMWLENMTANEESGLSMTGQALDPETDSPDVGYTAIAAMLVRLSELDLVSNVWLDGAEKTIYGSEEWAEPTILFQVTTSVQKPVAEETPSDSSVPAPPEQPAE